MVIFYSYVKLPEGTGIYWLVVTGTWLEHEFPLKIVIGIDKLIFFRGIETTNQSMYSSCSDARKWWLLMGFNGV